MRGRNGQKHFVDSWSIFSDEKQNGVIDGVSEVKIDASAAKKRGPEVLSTATSFLNYNNFILISITLFFPTFS